MRKLKTTIIKSIIIFFILLLISSACSRNESESNPDVVAYVGEREISARDFQLNYEFGFAHLKETNDRKYSYLKYMINETLLFQEGYRLGLDESERVKSQEAQLLEELLVEELFRKKVDENIIIADDEIKDAITKSSVKWKLRYWVELNSEDALDVYNSMQVSGYTKVVQEILAGNPEDNRDLNDLETGYLTWLDIPPELLEKIKDLEIGEISKPIELQGVYLLIQITDITRSGISDHDYKNTYNRFKQILFYRKQNVRAASFVANFMNPKNVITKGNEFRILANALIEWKQHGSNSDSFLESVEKAGKTEPALLELKNNLENTFITFVDEDWTVKEFLNRFDPHSIKAKAFNKQLFRKQLKHQIAITIRNFFFVKEAIYLGLDRSEVVVNQLDTWRNKWVYEEARRFYTMDIKIDNTEAKKYFDDHLSRYVTQNGKQPEFSEVVSQVKRDAYIEQAKRLLETKIEQLKKNTLVKINRVVLDTITVSDSDKSRATTVFLFKSSSGRLAFPTVDPAWGL
ncbi:MAG: peptidyl-prolyl cis-trans isomerase [Bacteroidetes bacterium]|nr:peptidyl-prolyl cis-trans isomerase [Bacteroidota bacterium]